MLNYFINKFIKNSTDTNNPTVRTAYGYFAGILGIICNCVLFSTKLIVGIISNSLSIIADSINNLSDASSNIITLFGFHISNRPADSEHPYGHGRSEYLAGFAVSVIIIVIGIELFKSGVNKILHPEVVTFSYLSLGVLLFSIMVKLWMMYSSKVIAKKISSKTLEATATDSRNDVITTSAVLLSSLISHYTHWELDGYMSVAVSVFILISGYGILKDTLDPLLGKAPEPELVQRIKDKILTYPGVLGTHDLLIHDYGPGRQFASVHIEMDADISSRDSHDVIDLIERDFMREHSLHLIVHLDPVSSEETDMQAWLCNKILSIDENLSIHDLHLDDTNDKITLSFDCSAEKSLEISDDDLKNKIKEIILQNHPDFNCDITIDRSFASIGK